MHRVASRLLREQGIRAVRLTRARTHLPAAARHPAHFHEASSFHLHHADAYRSMASAASNAGAEAAAPTPSASEMLALVYGGAHKRALEVRPRPQIKEPTDAIVRMHLTTLCGTDLHILTGDVPEVPLGLILGHEGVGVVEEVGSACTQMKKGDRVIVSCISSCGRCPACKKAMYSHCSGGGGWLLGHTIDGTQAGFVRVPCADTSLHLVPAGVSEEGLVMLSDILPTALEVGVLNGKVAPGDSVCVVGCGPIGLAAMLTAQLYTPAMLIAVDIDANRLAKAKELGATHLVNNAKGDAVAQVMALTEGRGVEVAVECLGMEATFDVCQKVVAPGGHLANIGVHGKPVSLEIQRLWSHNITLTTGLVDTSSTPQLLKLVQAGKLAPETLVSHRFKLHDIMHAYDVFGKAASEKALKVIIQCDGDNDAHKAKL